MATWRKLITEALGDDDRFENLTIEIEDGGLDREFDDGYGSSQGVPFTAWSKNWVYFPVVYDGSEWVGVVPRNPTPGYRCHHVGGE